MQVFRAKYYTKKDDQVICSLCPHLCRLSEGKKGICRVRQHKGGELTSLVYGLATGIHADPLEKKPLYHFYPGRSILSVGTAGCNLKCFFCQNHHISQAEAEEFDSNKLYSPQDLLEIAGKYRENTGIAFTYNEPVVFYEYMLDTAHLFRERGYRNVMVSNGYIMPAPLNELLSVMDAFNIDLKSFDNNFYVKHTGGKLQPVLESIEMISDQKKHLEITFLLIPGLNDQRDSFTEMVKWISTHTGPDPILHISRYFPRYMSKTESTSFRLLDEFCQIAASYIPFVYQGNTDSDRWNHTFCPDCGELCIKRERYEIINHLSLSGTCRNCGRKILNFP